MLAIAPRKTEIMLATMDLHDVLCDLGITQEALAQQMEVGQSNGSREVHRTNINVNILQDAIEAMGGKLVIIAHFPDKDYRIEQFAAV